MSLSPWFRTQVRRQACAVRRVVMCRGLAVLITGIGLMLGLGCRGEGATVLARLDEARSLAAALRVQFGQAVDASNRAVMANTDEASLAFAHESEQATATVERDLKLLTGLLSGMRLSDEGKIIQDFSVRFSEYRELDRRILALAVENTNLKAHALSVGPAHDAASSLRRSLESFASSSPAKDRCVIDALVVKAVLSVREIQVLYAPHIAERDDVAMTRMEKEMAELEGTATGALKALEELASPSSRSLLAEAVSSFDKFKRTSTQIVALSRRNTNVLSLELALRAKPPLVSACNDRLRTLQDALAKELFTVQR